MKRAIDRFGNASKRLGRDARLWFLTTQTENEKIMKNLGRIQCMAIYSR